MKIERMILVLVLPFCMYAVSCASPSQAPDEPTDPPPTPNVDADFLAGAAKVEITPPLGVPLVGGFGGNPAKVIHDPLYVKALILDDKETTLVFVALDLLSVDFNVADEMKKQINEAMGIPTANIVVSATHTHYGPSATGARRTKQEWENGRPLDSYQSFLARQTLTAVKTAHENLAAATIGFGTLDMPQHVFNRRWIMHDPVMNPFGELDKVMMNPGRQNPNADRPAGPIDPEISFIAVRSPEGKPIAVWANYSLHYVGGVPRGDVTADYYGIFSERIRQLVGGAADGDKPFVGIMTNGTSGDVNNIDAAAPSEGYDYYVKMGIVANDVAQEVYRVYKEIDYKDKVVLKASQTELPLAVRKPTTEMYQTAVELLKRPADDYLYHVNERTYASRIIDMNDNWPSHINIVLQAFRIGDVAISAIPFEVFATTGLELKSRSPFGNTVNIGLANGAFRYLPTPEQHELGGYETWMGSNLVEKDATVKIVDALVTMFGQLK